MQPPWIEYIFMHIYTLHYFTLLSLCNVKLVVNVTVKRQGLKRVPKEERVVAHSAYWPRVHLPPKAPFKRPGFSP